MMIRRTAVFSLAAAAVLLSAALPCRGLIRKDFTPLDVVKQSDQILRLELTAKPDSMIVTARVLAALKGKAAAETMTIDLTAPPIKEQGLAVRKAILRDGKLTALLFVGKMAEGQGDGGGDMYGDPYAEIGPPGEDSGEETGLLHMDGFWVRLIAAGEGKWDMDKVDLHLQGTWAGGTDMLDRAAQYIIADPQASVPVDTNIGNQTCGWAQTIKLGRIEGKVAAARVLRLTGGGPPLLYVACDKGDRLFAYEAAGLAMKDVTADHGLQSRSLAATVGDFNGDGRLDLAGWDGESLRVYLQDAAGKFAAGPQLAAGRIGGGCVGLATMGTPGSGRAAVLVSTQGVPQCVTLDEKGELAVRPLTSGDFAGGRLGAAGACLVGDLDGDAVADVLQPFGPSSLLYRGKADGTFAAAAVCPIALGKGRSAACLGDYDADGLLDVFTVGEDGKRLYQSTGGGAFVERCELTGELAYIAKPGGVACQSCDVNNDGRQDVLICYAGIPAQLFFNRGFRSFGHSHALDLDEKKLVEDVPEAQRGQQAGCVGDLDGDGAQDLALVFGDGQVRVFLRFVLTDNALAAHVGLPMGKPPVGPVTVVGRLPHRSLGAWPVVAGASDAFFGLTDPATITVQWQSPGGTAKSMDVDVEEEPIRIELGGK